METVTPTISVESCLRNEIDYIDFDSRGIAELLANNDVPEEDIGNLSIEAVSNIEPYPENPILNDLENWIGPVILGQCNYRQKRIMLNIPAIKDTIASPQQYKHNPMSYSEVLLHEFGHFINRHDPEQKRVSRFLVPAVLLGGAAVGAAMGGAGSYELTHNTPLTIYASVVSLLLVMTSEGKALQYFDQKGWTKGAKWERQADEFLFAHKAQCPELVVVT